MNLESKGPDDQWTREHIGRIRTKIANLQIGELIKEHLNWHPTDLRMASAKYFTESGKVSGNLYLAIEIIAKQFAEFAIEQPLINKYKNQVLESREEDSLASDKATSKDCCYALLKDTNSMEQ